MTAHGYVPKALCLYPTFSSGTRQDCQASCGFLSPMLWDPRGPELQMPQKKVLKAPLLPRGCGTSQLSTALTAPASAGTSSATSFNLPSASFTPLFLQMGLGWPAQDLPVCLLEMHFSGRVGGAGGDSQTLYPQRFLPKNVIRSYCLLSCLKTSTSFCINNKVSTIYSSVRPSISHYPSLFCVLCMLYSQAYNVLPSLFDWRILPTLQGLTQMNSENLLLLSPVRPRNKVSEALVLALLVLHCQLNIYV